ncbi:dihydrodipicolinate synthase family protein [Micromonospora sp. NBC_01813]|uniref:dihydrodipicolinate synthase family protein n=1 Tax=Micromonospora sp. NBC_01813 TaxID=2975988 RepID=UPI002DDB2CA3|nr:dihydrodipicolinate synthase family protein [Micromonospora sp. NBC_01813]WSA08627.1 dihydrodipicolinate synthase family protein [Micromonospora sp. NBC_01813]
MPVPTRPRRPWHQVVAAVVTPFRRDLTVDFDRLQEQVRWLAEQGCHGVAAACAFGEYQTLSDAERVDLVRAAVQSAPADWPVLAGAGGYGSRQARHWAEQAAAAGAAAVLVPPPAGHPASAAEVVAHFREVAAVGLPVVAVNDPAQSRVDLTPDLLATVAETDGVVAVVDATADVRRTHRIRDLCPHLGLLAGTGDVLLESVVCGATGWLTGLANTLPALSVRLFDSCAGGDVTAALPLYAGLHPLLSWEGRPDAVQAVKLGMDIVGRYGGPCRPPRNPLPPVEETRLRRDLARALGAAADR